MLGLLPLLRSFNIKPIIASGMTTERSIVSAENSVGVPYAKTVVFVRRKRKSMKKRLFVVMASAIMLTASSASLMAAPDYPDPQDPCTVTVQFPMTQTAPMNPVNAVVGLWQAGITLLSIMFLGT